ncbi:MAG: non-heme iron oxygenase ferredoxin subunit [Chloroflexi bacterium]|nr:non-heme iron oxygenase ferredoxin subunit [Chloroflexota bacterium]
MREGFVAAAKMGELAPGDMKLLYVGNRPVALANLGGDYVAFSDTCTHQECSLSDGTVEGESVECPCHGSIFNARTGAVEEGPAQTPLAVHEVRIQGEDILVGPPQTG